MDKLPSDRGHCQAFVFNCRGIGPVHFGLSHREGKVLLTMEWAGGCQEACPPAVGTVLSRVLHMVELAAFRSMKRASSPPQEN